MREDIECYVQTCLICQQDKSEQHKPGGLLEPLPIAEHPWESITMDFITALPKSKGLGTIMVVVDRFSKYATFIPASPGCTAKEAAQFFFKFVVKYWGLPRHIISDRDPHFTGHFWRELFRMLGTELHFSTSFHPQTDGQTERVNNLLECYLRHYVSAHQRDWVDLLDAAQFSYNLQRSEATGKTPFELATGQQPLTPASLPAALEGKSLGAYAAAKGYGEQLDIAKAHLAKAARRMKKFADRSRRPTNYQPGDLVLVKFNARQFKALRRVNPNLVRKYEGPFEIVAKVGKISYRLDLPPSFRIHPVFHASVLKPYHEDKGDPSRGQSRRAPMTVTASYDRDIEAILDYQALQRRGQPADATFLVHWKGQSPDEATWESYEDLWQFRDRVRRFMQQQLQQCAEDAASSGGGA